MSSDNEHLGEMLRNYLCRWRFEAIPWPMRWTLRAFNSMPRLLKQLPPRPRLDEADITEAFLKGTGPGGQKIVSVEHSCNACLSNIACASE